MRSWRSLAWAPFSRGFARPFVTGAYTWSDRQGVLLKAEDEAGRVYYAEASPLPGVSREGFLQVQEYLRGASASQFLEDGEAFSLAPSLQFAWDSLSFSHPARGKVESNALFGIQSKEALAKAFESAFAQGYRCFKIKVSPEYFQAIAPLLMDWQSRVRLRLDANNSFSLSELSFACSQGLVLEYWEDPLKNPEELPVDFASFPFYLDAGIDDWSRLLWGFEHKSYGGLILKPTVLGGLRLTERALQLAPIAKKGITITTAWEVEVGRRALWNFLLGKENLAPAGLSTGYLFRENYLADVWQRQTVPALSPEEERWLKSLDWRSLSK